MKKDKKFLNDLEKNLVGIKDKYKQEILSKYENKIKEEKANNKKITTILKEIGKPIDVAKKEIEALGNKGKESFFDVARNKVKDISQKRKINKEAKNKLKDEKNATKRLNDKNIKVSVNNKTVKSKKVKDKEKLEKEKKILEEKKSIKSDKEKTDYKEKLEKVKEFFVKDRFGTGDKKDKKVDKVKKDKKKKENNKDKNKESFANKFKLLLAKINPKKKERKIETSPKEIIEEIKEEFQEEVSEVSEIIAEKHVFESKEVRKKRIIYRTIGVLLTIVLLFMWLWVCVVLVASLIAYLDGVKFTGIIIGLFGLSLLMLWIVVMVNRSIFGKKMSVRLNLIIVIVSIIIIAIGIGLTLKQFYDIKTVKDVSVKYSMTTKMSNYDLPEDKDKKFNITFNSNYKTQYTINYDERMKDNVKIEVKYYECYYDYYIKQSSNSAYISLKLDNRDRLSVYIDDLKDGLVFDNDELSRYSVKITVNEKDVDRLAILD